MRIFNRDISINISKKKDFQRSIVTTDTTGLWGVFGGAVNNFSVTKTANISTAYRCTELLCNSIAILPLIPYNIKGNWNYKDVTGSTYNLLNIKPNQYQNAYNFKYLIMAYALNKGNAYIKIARDNNFESKSLHMLESDYIRVLINGQQVSYNTPNNFQYPIVKQYQNILTGEVYEDADIIHIMNKNNNGFCGISTIASAALTLNLAYNELQHSNNFFESGANSNAILTPLQGSPVLDKTQTEQIKNKLHETTSAAAGKSGNVIVMGIPMDVKSLGISPKDSQLLEAREFDSICIAQFYGVPLSKIFRGSNTYSSNEQEQLEFLNNLLPWLEQIETEFFIKLYNRIEWGNYELEFDTTKLMRMDSTARASYYSQLYQMGAISTNEIRGELKADNPVKGGNEYFIQANLMPINKINNEQIDNKLK